MRSSQQSSRASALRFDCAPISVLDPVLVCSPLVQFMDHQLHFESANSRSVSESFWPAIVTCVSASTFYIKGSCGGAALQAWYTWGRPLNGVSHDYAIRTPAFTARERAGRVMTALGISHAVKRTLTDPRGDVQAQWRPTGRPAPWRLSA